MTGWEILAVWIGGSVVFTPMIGYLLSMSDKSAAQLDATIIPFRPQTAGVVDDLSRRQPRQGTSAFHR
jgi:hypothetical protein